jgi:nucleotide-binding universal stress UspA family protein
MLTSISGTLNKKWTPELITLLRAEHPGLDVVTEPSAGPVGSLLVEGAEPGDLVVVGASTHKGTAGVLYGNTSHYLIRESPCPVAVVPTTAHRGAPDRVVVGVDGSVDSHEALLWAGDEADHYGVGLAVVHAWNYPYRPADPASLQARDVMRIDAACVLESAAAVARDRFAAEVSTELLEAAAAAALIEAVRDGDLLVLGSRGRGALMSTIFGSTVNAVIEASAVPVVVVRPGRSALVDRRD